MFAAPGKSNIAFMHGPEHKALRNSFLSLFSQMALGQYLTIQERIVRSHLKTWLQFKNPTEIRTYIRDLNTETSQSVFLGPYIDDPAAFAEHYINMTTGFVVAPIPLPGTALWRAIQSRKSVVKILNDCVIRSKAAMKSGEVGPRCLLDHWTTRCLKDEDEAASKGEPMPSYADSHRMVSTKPWSLVASLMRCAATRRASAAFTSRACSRASGNLW